MLFGTALLRACSHCVSGESAVTRTTDAPERKLTATKNLQYDDTAASKPFRVSPNELVGKPNL